MSSWLNKFSLNSQKLTAEFIATMTFVAIGVGSVGATLAAEADSLLIVSLAHGLGIALGVFLFAKVSGAHMNPVVTIAFCLAGKMRLTETVQYIAAQLLGATAGYYIIANIGFSQYDQLGVHAVTSDIGIASTILIEAFMTFVLVFTVFTVTSDRFGFKGSAPIVIGLVIVATNLAAIPLTGASLNPARSFAPALANLVWRDHWIYWLAPLIGSVIAVFVYTFLFGTGEDRKALLSTLRRD